MTTVRLGVRSSCNVELVRMAAERALDGETKRVSQSLFAPDTEQPGKAARRLVEARGFDPDGWRSDAMMLLRDLSEKHKWPWSKCLRLVNLILDPDTQAEVVFTRLMAEEIAA